MMIFFGRIFAQSPQEEAIMFDKSTVPGVSLLITSYPIETIKAALQNRFEKTVALKGTNVKGFRAYLSQPFTEFGTLNYDIYTHVVQEGNKKNNQVSVKILVSKGNNNFASSATDAELIESVKRFLTAFVPYLKEFDLNQKISELEKTNVKLSSELEKLKSEKSSIEQKIGDKEKSIQTHTEEITKFKEQLNTLKTGQN
jgi:valyl-tRNA synthetase